MTFDEELKRAFDTLSARLHGEVVRQVAATKATSGDESSSCDLAASERMLAAIRAIDRASSLREVLDALVGAAGREASRVAPVLVRADKFQSWRFIGFDPALDTAVRTEISRGQAGALLEAAASGAGMSGDGAVTGTAPGFATRSLTERLQVGPMATGNRRRTMSARRHARLLTSEIKLYHEQEVIAGRRIDHLQAGLVRTLADGDADLVESQNLEG
jgi:hypothetical protein